MNLNGFLIPATPSLPQDCHHLNFIVKPKEALQIGDASTDEICVCLLAIDVWSVEIRWHISVKPVSVKPGNVADRLINRTERVSAKPIASQVNRERWGLVR